MLKTKPLVLASLMSALLFVAGEAAAELKVGYVNTQRIFRDAPAAQKAGKKLESEFAINRKDFGIVYAGMADDLIRDEVVVELKLEAVPEA